MERDNEQRLFVQLEEEWKAAAVGQVVAIAVDVSQQLNPIDLTDSQWGISQEVILPAISDGRPRSLAMRTVSNAIL